MNSTASDDQIASILITVDAQGPTQSKIIWHVTDGVSNTNSKTNFLNSQSDTAVQINKIQIQNGSPTQNKKKYDEAIIQAGLEPAIGLILNLQTESSDYIKMRIAFDYPWVHGNDPDGL